MRISRIKVNNFKSLVDFDLPMEKFTCLIGLTGPAVRTDRQRHPQPAADRPPVADQQGAGAADSEPRAGESEGERRARRLGADLAARVVLIRDEQTPTAPQEPTCGAVVF